MCIAAPSKRMPVHAMPLHILLVDDDHRSTHLLARMLREDGFLVEVAIDGTCALTQFESNPMIAALVTDLKIPSIDGVTLIQHVYTKKPDLPVLIITSYLEIFATQLASLVPRPQVLTKPIRYSEVHSILNAIAEDVAKAL